MAGRSLRRIPFALAATALLGCGNIDEARRQLADKYRPAIAANLAMWPSIAEQLRSSSTLATDGIAGAPVFTVDAFTSHDELPNAALCYAEDLDSPDELGYVPERMADTGELNHCASLLHRGHLAYDPAQPAKPLQKVSLAEGKWRYPRCAGYRYLLVIRSLAWLPPTATVPATEPFVPVAATLALDATPPASAPPPTTRSRRAQAPTPTPLPAEGAPESVEKLMPERHTGTKHVRRHLFEGGFLRAELLAFALPAGKLLGGWRFAAQNNVELDGKGDEPSADLQRQVRKAIAALLEKSAPSRGGQP